MVFDDDSLEAALDRSLAAATHLTEVDAAAVKAARSLARKIDAWDVIVDWAHGDMDEMDKKRPAVPDNDNVSASAYLKYLAALGLVPAVSAADGKKAAPQKSELDEWRERQAQRAV